MRRIVTGYSGDVFPNFTPNPIFSQAYLRRGRGGALVVPRLPAAPRGRRARPPGRHHGLAGRQLDGGEPRATRRSTRRSARSACSRRTRPTWRSSTARSPTATATSPSTRRCSKACGVRWPRARGAVVTVEQVVDDIRPWAHLVRLPAHRVLSVSECPMGAHPGGLYGRFTPAEPYGEDVEFWAEVRDGEPRRRLRRLDPRAGARRRGPRRLDRRSSVTERRGPPPPAGRPGLVARRRGGVPARPRRRRRTTGRRPPRSGRACSPIASSRSAPTPRWPGPGVANLATWLGVRTARAAGSTCVLSAELGLWGYEPTPADPFVFNHRAFPSATMLADSSEILGMVMPGPGTTSVACLGAAIIDASRQHRLDRDPRPGVPRRVGRRERRRLRRRRRGGGDDAHAATHRGGGAVRDLAGHAGLAPRHRPRRVREARRPLRADRSGGGRRRASPRCGTSAGGTLVVADDVAELDPPTAAEVEALRRWDPRGFFLRA